MSLLVYMQWLGIVNCIILLTAFVAWVHMFRPGHNQEHKLVFLLIVVIHPQVKQHTRVQDHLDQQTLWPLHHLDIVMANFIIVIILQFSLAGLWLVRVHEKRGAGRFQHPLP
eukprot:TRINITY_DN8801_c0_g1_i7.p3 TRINITY_DN8801_c0_g1~~TRINITY_DN8801_c0_g1_i7.p3  ORF type:complete len:112 (+),score=6.75 TRINITY_DN8801_c0_g1_i7:301-636(+)